MNDRPWHLTSFPRSGNHMVRALLEAASGRATLGCPGAKNDAPIYLREPNKAANVISVDPKQKPIALKSHFVTEIWKHDRKHSPYGMILIIRDPATAITSNLLREAQGQEDTSLQSMAHATEPLFRQYLALLYAFKAYPKDRRILVKFEDIVQDDQKAVDVIDEIGRKIGTNFKPLTLEDVRRIKTVSKDSQHSLGKSNPVLKKMFQLGVKTRINYTDVLKMLESDLPQR